MWKTLQTVEDAGKYLTAPTKADARRVHWLKASVTTDASGYVVVTHGAGFLPTAVVVTSGIAAGPTSIGMILVDDTTLSATTVKLRPLNAAGAAMPSSPIIAYVVCYE